MTYLLKTNGTKIPTAVMEVVDRIGEFFTASSPTLFVADHTHEELSPGAWSIAWEGWEGDTIWPTLAINDLLGSAAAEGWHFEPVTAWCLGIFPTSETFLV